MGVLSIFAINTVYFVRTPIGHPKHDVPWISESKFRVESSAHSGKPTHAGMDAHAKRRAHAAVYVNVLAM